MSTPQAYKDNKGSPILRKSFCAYFDILGFSDKLKVVDIDFYNTYLGTLYKELDAIRNLQSPESEASNKFEIRIFTDNFIMGYPWNNDHGEIELGATFRLLSQLQYNFILSDIFIRGAVCISDLYIDEYTVLGPAIVEAYNLESQIANHPRIILSKEVCDIVGRHIKYYANKFNSPQNKEYLVDIDGNYFINYLFITIDWPDNNKQSYIQKVAELIKNHKSSVEKNLNKYKQNFKLHDKYSWVANYHNYFCENFLPPIGISDITDIKIDKNLLNNKINRIIK